jgi:hypothetical protein
LQSYRRNRCKNLNAEIIVILLVVGVGPIAYNINLGQRLHALCNTIFATARAWLPTMQQTNARVSRQTPRKWCTRHSQTNETFGAGTMRHQVLCLCEQFRRHVSASTLLSHTLSLTRGTSTHKVRARNYNNYRQASERADGRARINITRRVETHERGAAYFYD